METTDRSLTLSINNELVKTGNGRDRQNGVNKCDDNAKNRSMSRTLNITLEYVTSSN